MEPIDPIKGLFDFPIPSVLLHYGCKEEGEVDAFDWKGVYVIVHAAPGQPGTEPLIVALQSVDSKRLGHEHWNRSSEFLQFGVLSGRQSNTLYYGTYLENKMGYHQRF